MHKISQVKKTRIKNPILIEGLPGIGNVGKIAVDFMVDNLKARKIYEIESTHFPHAVFINEDNLVDLPIMEIYHKRIKNKDVLFLAGDIQPIDENSCYTFCNEILNLFEKLEGKEIITLGGIGLQKIPEEPRVFCTANDSKIVKRYMTKNLNNNIYGVVGPIVGVSGLLVGLSKKRNLQAIALLAETFNHPNYLGIKGAKELLKVLNKKLNLDLNLDVIEDEILEIEKEIKNKVKNINAVKSKKTIAKDTNYFG